MKSFIVLFVIGCGIATAHAYNFSTFNNEIDAKCLQRLWSPQNQNGQIRIQGLTMESFIAMVEKVERNNTQWNIFQTSRVLLKRFAFDGIEFIVTSGKRIAAQSRDDQPRWEILKALVGGEETRPERFNEEDLNELEKCNMFFMMGHLVNNTFREGLDDEAHELTNVPMDGNDFLRSPNAVKLSKRPREQGVVTIRGNKHLAIALNKILNAIVAGENIQEPLASDLFGIRDENFPKEKKINTLIGATLGDVLSHASIYHHDGSSGITFFGPGGEWNNSMCPTEFKLKANATGVTNALLRGAIDGLLISHAVQQLKGSGQESELKLSRVLRMYYSNLGIPVESGGHSTGISYCRRSDVLTRGIGADAIKESAEGYYQVHYYKKLGQVAPKNGENPINEAFNHMQSAINNLDGHHGLDHECSKSTVPDALNPICETPSNVFVVLDDSEIKSDGFIEQQEFVGHLATYLDIGKGAGSLTVLRTQRDGEELKKVYYNATNVACALCETAWIDPRSVSGASQTEVLVLEGINKTLQNFELKTDLDPAVPNKVVVLFHLADTLQETDKNRLNKAAGVLRNGHRDSRVIVIGKNSEMLQQMATDREDVVTGYGNPEKLAEEIAKKICEVPAVLQYNQCWNSKNRNEDLAKYTGYVTKGRVQYWAMHPEYFLKSYTVEFKFTPVNGDIKVCAERGVVNPGKQDNSRKNENNKCKETDNSNKEIVFTYKNPCHKYHVHNCPAINFAVHGAASQGAASRHFSCPAADDNCRRIDQVKFAVTHKGVFCSGCEFLKASPIVILVLALSYFFTKSV